MSELLFSIDHTGEATVKKGNSTLICGVKIHDHVKIKEYWGPKLGGKKGIVEDIKHHLNCESGFMVKVSCYEGFLDANWLIKL